MITVFFQLDEHFHKGTNTFHSGGNMNSRVAACKW